MSFKFAICHPWDMSGPSAEKALSLRLEHVCREQGIECIHTDVHGYVLDHQYRVTGRHISSVKNVEFIFHHHFASQKQCDSWAIFALWNPPFIPYDWHTPEIHINNYTHYDDYLSASDAGGLSIDHLNMLLKPYNREYDGANLLFSSLPKSIHLKPSLETIEKEAKLFYVGMNWEKIDGRQSRHAGLFRMLDDDNCINFYGPRVASGVETWKEFKCYRGEIPFDAGHSLIKVINETGVALTISSPLHQKSGIMTNRIFESAAAGAVIIADRNSFVERHFADSVFAVENEGDVRTTYRQIKEVLAEVKRNPKGAYEMAMRSQEIYMEKFSLDRNLISLLETVKHRKSVVGQQIYARNEKDFIDVVLRWPAKNLIGFSEAIESINKQLYRSIRVVVVCDQSLSVAVDAVLKAKLRQGITHKTVPMRIYASKAQKTRRLSTGDILAEGLRQVESDFVAFLEPLEIWHSDHLTSLKRSLEDNSEKWVVYTPSLKHVMHNEVINHNARDFPDELTVSSLLKNVHYHNRLGRIMVTKSYVDELMADGFPALCRFIDQIEAYPILVNALATNKAIFLPRTTYALKFYGTLARGMENTYENCIFTHDKQKLVLRTYLKGRVSMDDLKVLRPGSPAITEQNRPEQIDHDVEAQTEELVQTRDALIERTAELVDTRKLVEERTAELVDTRKLVEERTAELVDTRKLVEERTAELVDTRKLVEERTAELVDTRKLVEERTAELVDIRETLIERTLRLEQTARELQRFQELLGSSVEFSGGGERCAELSSPVT